MDTLLGRCFIWVVTACGIHGVIAVAAGTRFPRVLPHALVALGVHQTFSLGPLYSDGPLSSGPHREGVTETSLLARTRLVLLQGGFDDLWRRCRKACASLCRCERCNRTAVTSEVTSPNPVGGVIQPGSWRKAGTHWLSVGTDTGGRTGNIVRMLGPESPVDAPTALCECWGQGLDPRAGTHREGDQPKELAGDRPKHRRAPTQELVLLSGTRSFFFSIASVSVLALQRTFTVWEVVVHTWAVVGVCGLFRLVYSGTMVFPVWYSVFHSRLNFSLFLFSFLVLCRSDTCTSLSCSGGPRHRCARLQSFPSWISDGKLSVQICPSV